jgi:hypothetical protein
MADPINTTISIDIHQHDGNPRESVDLAIRGSQPRAIHRTLPAREVEAAITDYLTIAIPAAIRARHTFDGR